MANPKDVKFVTLQDIPKNEWDGFKEKVKAAGGKATVLVFPYSVHDAPESYYEAVEELLKDPKNPLVVLEAGNTFKVFKERLKAQGMPAHLVLPTASDYPALIVRPNKTLPYLREYDDTSKEFARHLKEAGVKDVSVAGAHTRVKPEEIVARPHEGAPRVRDLKKGCAGLVFSDLMGSKQFDYVQMLPKACFPEPGRFFQMRGRFRSLRHRTARRFSSFWRRKR